MRLLMTGFRKDYLCERSHSIGANANDCCTEAIIRAVEESGHHIDVRQVRPGEDLDNYDLIVVGIDNPQAWGTKPFLGALWAMLQGRHGGTPCVALFTHWNMKSIWQGLVQVEKHHGKLFSEFMAYDFVDDARHYEDEMRELLLDLVEGDWPWTMTNAWPWADQVELALDMPFTSFDSTFDPSLVMSGTNLSVTRDRGRKWVLGTHEDHNKWIAGLRPAWDVIYHGKYGNAEKIPKVLLMHQHNKYWGALVPPYERVGGGYWRARIVHAANLKNVIYCDPRELPPDVLGDAFDLPPLAEFERLNAAQLRSWAEAQHGALIQAFTPREKAIDSIVSVFRMLSRESPRDSQLKKLYPEGYGLQEGLF